MFDSMKTPATFFNENPALVQVMAWQKRSDKPYLYQRQPNYWCINNSLWRTSSSTPGLSHQGQVTHIGVRNQVIIGLDNVLLPVQGQANNLTNAVVLLIQPLGTIVCEISI